MALYLNQGDTAQSAIVIKTLNEKSYIKAGVTSNMDVQMPSAEVI